MDENFTLDEFIQFAEYQKNVNHIDIDTIINNLNNDGLQKKLDDYAETRLYLNAQIDVEKKLINERKEKIKSFERQLETINDKLVTLFNVLGVDELKGLAFRHKTALSYSTEIVNEELIPDEFKTTETITKIDKNAIKKLLREGEIITGAKLNSTWKVRAKV